VKVFLEMLAVLLALLIASALISPRRVHAQAAPGPLPPAAPKDASSSAAAAKSQLAPPPHTTLSGTWKLNPDDSDDGQKKMEQARGNRGGHGGPGGYPGGYPGGGYPGGGMGGHHSGHMNDQDRDAMREVLEPSDTLTLVKQDAELDLTDSNGRKRVFYTDGRKLQKSKDENYKEIKAHWHVNELVSDEKTPRGSDLSRTFELGPEGQQLYETIRFHTGRENSLVVIRYVYDLAEPVNPSSVAPPQTKSAHPTAPQSSPQFRFDSLSP